MAPGEKEGYGTPPRHAEGGGGGLFESLRRDHREISDLFRRIDATPVSDMDTLLNLFSRIEKGLKVHMEGEERFFFTALERHEAPRHLVLECFEEHHLMKMMVSAFASLAFDDHRWGAKLRVLRRMAEQHMEREERELFRMAREVLSEEELPGIAEQFLRLKKEGEK